MRATLDHPDTVPLAFASLALLAAFAAGLSAPVLFPLVLGGSVAAGAAFLTFCFPIRATVAWLFIAGMSLEMTFHDLIGDEAFQPTIAVIKGVELGIAVLIGLRFGLRIDLFSPVWAFLAMLGAGMMHGLYPGLTSADSLRSAIGSATPFVFGFCRLPPTWAPAVIRACKWCPLVAVVAGLPLEIAGIRPLFIDSGGARLAGLGHPAFLANVCLPGIYACLIELFRLGRRGDLTLLMTNFLIMLLTGARAPLVYAGFVCATSLSTIRAPIVPTRDRLILALGAAALLPLAFAMAGDLDEIRVFNLLTHEASTSLSGRELLWPYFEHAAQQSAWFGWGAGAGNWIIPSEGHIARELHTWAAHNEYLRMEVEGGQVGRALLIGLFAAWVFVHTRRLRPPERRIMRLVFIAMAAHAVTDNLLISTPACVMFAFATAVFSRDRFALPDSRPLP